MTTYCHSTKTGYSDNTCTTVSTAATPTNLAYSTCTAAGGSSIKMTECTTASFKYSVYNSSTCTGTEIPQTFVGGEVCTADPVSPGNYYKMTVAGPCTSPSGTCVAPAAAAATTPTGALALAATQVTISTALFLMM